MKKNKNQFLCIKCNSVLKYILNMDLLISKNYYCSNIHCDRYGLITVVEKNGKIKD